MLLGNYTVGGSQLAWMEVRKLRAQRPAGRGRQCHQQGCEEMSPRLGEAECREDRRVREALPGPARGLQGVKLQARGRGGQQRSWQTKGGNHTENAPDSYPLYSIPPPMLKCPLRFFLGSSENKALKNLPVLTLLSPLSLG